MIKKIISLIVFALFSLSFFIGCSNDRLKALIVTGQNIHNWEVSHLVLSKILENSGRFKTDVALSPGKGEEMSSFSPEFADYDVVVMDYSGDDWPDATRTLFEDYVKNGGGVVIYHSANNSFPGWEAYNKITGLGGWGDRNEKSGPYVYWRNDSIIRDTSPGKGGSHGEVHDFVVEHRVPEHPILDGLPNHWLHPQDELYDQLRGPAENLEVLATAYADSKKGGSGRHEPVLMTINYGKGRVFHTTLGHVEEGERPLALQSAGFIYTLQRGAEWAATGNVTQSPPKDFSNVASALILPNYKGYTLNELFEGARQFQYGKTHKYLYLISQRIREANGDPAQWEDFERHIVATLESDATDECKSYLCRELSWMGSSASVSVLNELLKNDGTREMAAFALERISN